MESDRFDTAVRALVREPSRRALTRALFGVVAGSLVASRNNRLNGWAKNKKKKKKKIDWERFCRKEYQGGPFCPDFRGPKRCCYGGQVCGERGCCPAGYGKNCVTDTHYTSHDFYEDPKCCPDNSHCCYGANGEVSCCGPESACCGELCCEAPYNGPCCAEGCCHHLQVCCPDGRCRLAC